MYDMATPIVVGGRHLGNLFLGQFFFSDEPPDRESFRAQAQRYGFDEVAYLAALERTPRWNRDTIQVAMAFYAHLVELFSNLSYRNIQLARSMAEASYRSRARRFVTGSALADGDARLRAGVTVTLSGLGSLFDGDYYVVRVRHTYNLTDGYRTEFDVERPGLGPAER